MVAAEAGAGLLEAGGSQDEVEKAQMFEELGAT